MKIPPAGSVDSCIQGTGHASLAQFSGCCNSENFLARSSPIFVSSFELCLSASAGVCGGLGARGAWEVESLQPNDQGAREFY